MRKLNFGSCYCLEIITVIFVHIMTKISEQIDKLTRSIENAITGERFLTDVLPVSSSEIKASDWVFNWKAETKYNGRNVFKLVTHENPKVIHGLLSIEDKNDHIFMHLLESAKFNKGKNKVYEGVAGNLVAYACKVAFEYNYDGIVSFVSKTQLIKHYQETLGAQQFGRGSQMFIDTPQSYQLFKRYFPNEKQP